MATKTEIIFFLVFFYAILGVIAGIMGNYFNDDVSYETENSKTLSSFTMTDIISGFTELGTTFNVAFFGSFIIIIGWIIVSSLPTFNGGG